MKVRDGNPFDIPALLDMLRQYRELTPLPFLSEADDAIYMTNLLTQLMAGRGVVLIAENNNVPIGMFMASIAPSVWSPDHFVMTELAFWVNPESRGSSAGYRLLSAYVEHGNALKTAKRIHAFFISKMVNSPNIKYEKFGFSKLEETWVA